MEECDSRLLLEMLLELIGVFEANLRRKLDSNGLSRSFGAL